MSKRCKITLIILALMMLVAGCGNSSKADTVVNTYDVISFERAWKAAGLSSNMNDYFDESEAVLVANK